jgi:hypothetical protein
METTQLSMIADYLVQAAGIPPPWRATKHQFDGIAKTVQIWITRSPLPQVETKRNWFGMTSTHVVTSVAATGPDQHWRHLNCMDYICQIHTLDELDPRHHDLPWLGKPGMPFTNRLSREVFTCLAEGMDINAVCSMLNVPFTDLWKFKYALDNGQVSFDYTPRARTRQQVAANTAMASPTPVPETMAAPPGNSAVPDVTHPLWERLITGQLDIQIKTLSFQLILTKLRQQVSLQQSNEVRLMKLRELHRYVERNARSLDLELKQLREIAQSETA